MRTKKEAEIVRLLKAGWGYTSGQAISSALGITRTAVWKHIKTLKEMGYSIQASPSKGYRLDPDVAPFNGVEISSGLSTDFIGREIHFYPSIGSTNVKAFELARNGAPEGAAVLADAQTRGKGRVGRHWESPGGVNLYTSVILRPMIQPQNAHNLTFVAAVAVAEAVSAFVPTRPTVKWPNDILIDAKKAAGILMEMDSEPDRVHFVVMGIGINVNMRASSLPEPVGKIATSIIEKSGVETDRATVARSVYSSIEKWYKIYLEGGFGPVLEAWKGYFDSAGKTVRVTSFGSVRHGVCMGVDGDGALLLRSGTGAIERVISGDVEAES